MRKTMAVTMILGMILLGINLASAADIATRVKVKVPFAFYAGEQVIPAGDYRFELRSIGPHSASTTLVAIMDMDGKTVCWMPTMPNANWKSGADDHLHFTKVGGKYFLARVEGGGYEAEVIRSITQKNLVEGLLAKK